MIAPRYQSERVTLYCGDCLDVLPQLTGVDAVVTDPPYGIGRDVGNDTTRGSGFYPVQLRKQYHGGWDTERADGATMTAILRVGTVIVWGGNFYSDVLPVSGRWLVWDKCNTMPTFSDCELAWTNLPGTSVKMLRYSGNGLMASEKDRVHPTQKPISLMRWCIEFTKGGTILDPFMGSGTTGVAAMQLGRRFIGIEISEEYYKIAERRIRDAEAQLLLPGVA